jgi:DNA-binding MarR family transcriptional regulator
VATKRRRQKRGHTEPAENAVNLGPLNGYVGFMLRRAQTAVFGDFIASLGQLDLRPAQYALLEVVDANPGLKQSDAAAALGIQKANFVSLVNSLERRSLLRRSRSEGDRRSYALHLEPAGARLLKRARGLQHAQESRLVAQLGASGRENLLTLLNQLAAAG